MMNFWRRRKYRSGRGHEIFPDEILIDSTNLPQFDTSQFEGRLERPIARKTLILLAGVFVLIGLAFISKVWVLQVKKGEVYAAQSENNRLRHTLIFSERGVIYDRNGELVAWNTPHKEGEDFAFRQYVEGPAFSHIAGYVKYPQKDSAGFYYQTEYVGTAGVEKFYNELLVGSNGIKIIETDALGAIKSGSVIHSPSDGENITLSVDSRLQSKLYESIANTARSVGFEGGAGVIIDVRTGEIIAMTSYPGYDSNTLSVGEDREAINEFIEDERNPFLNRAVSGLYTPGSIVKPFLAIAALEEGVISPSTEILSTGSLEIQNPYFPDQKTVFRDWKAHGWTDMREAIAVSSDVYFYQIGGGYESQKGLGVSKIEKYMRSFGFGDLTGIDLGAEAEGVIPNPEWKKEHFDGEEWLLGNTYHTAIGQYGVQVTVLQAARAVGAIANGGELYEPTLLKQNGTVRPQKELLFEEDHFRIAREGMRQAVTNGTAGGLFIPGFEIAAKTGTAELGTRKQFVNSWVIGFFPYDEPRYAFATVMERGPQANLIGATSVMRTFMDWLIQNAPEYGVY